MHGRAGRTMEATTSDNAPRPAPSSLIPPFPRDARGSLEVFNPSTSFSKPGNASFPKPGAGADHLSPRPAPDEEVIPTPWMAIKDPAGSPLFRDTASILDYSGKKPPAEVGAAAQRAAEWGLVLKTDEETGRLQGVGVRKSGDEFNKMRNSGIPI